MTDAVSSTFVQTVFTARGGCKIHMLTSKCGNRWWGSRMQTHWHRARVAKWQHKNQFTNAFHSRLKPDSSGNFILGVKVKNLMFSLLFFLCQEISETYYSEILLPGSLPWQVHESQILKQETKVLWMAPSSRVLRFLAAKWEQISNSAFPLPMMITYATEAVRRSLDLQKYCLLSLFHYLPKP